MNLRSSLFWDVNPQKLNYEEEAGRKLVETEFNADKIAESWIEVYRELMA